MFDAFLVKCPNYLAYLDSYITCEDRRYIRNLTYCRTLVTLNYRSKTNIYSKPEFEDRKTRAFEVLYPKITARKCYSDDYRCDDPVLAALALREKANLQKNLSTIIFFTHKNKAGFETSSFIDYDHSLRRSHPNMDDWPGIFSERVKLRPRQYHLSFYDWHKATFSFQNSDNYMCVHDAIYGLVFMHRGDHKKIYIHPTKENPTNYFSEKIFSPIYGHVQFFDHEIRKKI